MLRAQLLAQPCWCSALPCTQADVKCQEDCSGRPYALVLTKTRASFKWRAAQYQRDRASIETLKRMLPGGG